MNFLGFDVGTTCCKCQLFSERGEILAYFSEEYPLLAADGERYVDIEGVYHRLVKMMKAVAAVAPVDMMAISCFGESFVMLDEKDEMLFPPMLYTDPRGEEEAKEIAAAFGEEELFARTGVLPHSMFSVSKLLWIKRHRRDLYDRTAKVMLICDYLGYRLTGERVIDYALASRTGAFNLKNREMDGEILQKFGIDPALFSHPKPTGTVVGKLRGEIAKTRGLEHVTLILGTHDQVSAALGAGAVRAGDAIDGLGTVECITAIFREQSADVSMGRQGYACVPYVNGLWCTYMFNYASGALINWFKGLLHDYHGEEARFFDYIERGMPEGPTGIYTLPYFAGAATPRQNLGAKGAVIGLTTTTTDSALYKSILEGTAMEMRFNAETALRYGIEVKRAVATGGGANSSAWLQLKADIQNIPIRTLRSSEGGLCGLAIIQAYASRLVSSLEEAADVFVRFKGEYLPNAAAHAAYERQYSKYKKIYGAVKEFY